MAKSIKKLTALKIAKFKAPGIYGDGGGLYLRKGTGIALARQRSPREEAGRGRGYR